MKSESKFYKAAGVDITAGYEAVKRMAPHVERTRTPEVLQGLGGFGALFQPDLTGITTPVLVSGTDGVGTKLKLAFAMDKHDTVGIDCVAMCANDILCQGAKPLFFLDYLAVGKADPVRIAEIVQGVAEGCVQAGCALVGGETAEMPGFYPDDEYDLAGFCVGIVDREKMLGAHRVKLGDAIIALPSSGVHSNGFSLVRKLLGDTKDALGEALGLSLLNPTRIYAKAMEAALTTGAVHAAAHITGGGLIENIPRMLPSGMMARIDMHTIPVQDIFVTIAKAGHIPARDMANTFNVGVGFVLAVGCESVPAVLSALTAVGEKPFVIGAVVPGDGIDLIW